MIFKAKKILIGASVLVAVVLIGTFFYLLEPVSDTQGKTISFEINPGMSFGDISSGLAAMNLIRSKLIFQIYGIVEGQAQYLKPGIYKLSSNFTVPKLLNILALGPQDVSVVVFPGLTVSEVDSRLSDAGIIKKGELVGFNPGGLENEYPWLTNYFKSAKIGKDKDNKLEGFIFPDTYYFAQKSDVKVVVEKFLDNFAAKALPFFGKDDNLSQTVILASILEKETPEFKDKRVAAGILLKRIDLDMPLQVDSTIIYFKCSGKFSNCPSLTANDFQIDSSYNTYKYLGLPNGPISNPGLDSIKAALDPEKYTPYLYYLSDPKTKKTIFSKTLDEHNENRVKFLLNS